MTNDHLDLLWPLITLIKSSERIPFPLEKAVGDELALVNT